MATHDSEHVGLDTAAETGQQPATTNEPVRARSRKTVRFNPLTAEYGSASGVEYGDLSPPAPLATCALPLEQMLDKYGDLLHCYQ